MRGFHYMYKKLPPRPWEGGRGGVQVLAACELSEPALKKRARYRHHDDAANHGRDAAGNERVSAHQAVDGLERGLDRMHDFIRPMG